MHVVYCVTAVLPVSQAALTAVLHDFKVVLKLGDLP